MSGIINTIQVEMEEDDTERQELDEIARSEGGLVADIERDATQLVIFYRIPIRKCTEGACRGGMPFLGRAHLAFRSL